MNSTSIAHHSQNAEKACHWLEFWTFHHRWSQEKRGSKAQCGSEEEARAEADAWVRVDCGWLTWWLPLLCAYFTLVRLILMGSDKSLNVAEDGGGVLLWKQHEKGLCWPRLPRVRRSSLINAPFSLLKYTYMSRTSWQTVSNGAWHLNWGKWKNIHG